MWQPAPANNYTGTSYNGLCWSGDAITFDGVDDYVNLGQINSEYATYAVKFMATNLNGTQQQLIGNEHVGGGGLIINTSNRLVGEFYIDGQYRQVASSVVLSANTQYSAAVTYNGSTIRLYLNGVETGTAINYTGKISLTRGTNDNGPTMMFLGANPQGNIGEAYYFKGKIYSAKVYNRALSSTEIANNYNGTSTAYDGAVKIISSSLTNLNQVIYSKTYGGTLGTQFTPNRPGYTFAGWYTAASGGTQVTSSTAVPAANTTYYAHWTAAPAVPIRFLGVGGIYNQWNSITGKYSALYNSGTSHGTESTWWDLSGTGNTGTANNITWGADYAQFNGTSSYVSLKAQNSSQATLIVTFSTASASTDQYIFGNWHAGGGGIRISSGKILGEFYIQSDWRTVNTGVSVVANKIYSVALSYDGSTVKVYVDGISKGTPVSITGSIGAPTNSTVMMMGCNPNGTTCEAKYFNGKIYEAAVMNDDLGDQMTGYNYGRTTTYDDNISVPNGARQGFDFAGWYDASSGGNRVYSNELFRKTGVSDLLLYARWTQILANGTFYIKPASNSNLCVEATNNATADNTLLRLYGCSSSRLGQKWRVTQMGDGYVNISNYRDTNNGNNSRITIKDTTPANGKSIV